MSLSFLEKVTQKVENSKNYMKEFIYKDKNEQENADSGRTDTQLLWLKTNWFWGKEFQLDLNPSVFSHCRAIGAFLFLYFFAVLFV